MSTKRLALIICVILCASCNLYASNSNTPMPLPFTKNMGQWPDSILFRASAKGATMWFTKNGIWYQFFRRIEKSDASATAIGGIPTDLWAADVSSAPGSVDGPALGGIPSAPNSSSPSRVGKGPGVRSEPDSIETTMIKAEFVGASESVEVIGLEELEYKCNYFIGNEPDKWRTDVPNYAAVTMRNLFPGVDVTFASHDGRILSEITAASSADLALVKVGYRSAENVTQQTSSSTMVQTSFGEHTFEGILLADGSETKSEHQTTSSTSSASGMSLVYSTYLGGSDYEYGGLGIAVDTEENAYLTGTTFSIDFPTQTAFQNTNGGGYDAFVTKLDSIGSELIYSTYIGGSSDEVGWGISVDAEGFAYVTGFTFSTNFPTQSPFQASNGGSADAFVIKLNITGNSLIYSTYIGGSSFDDGLDIAIDDSRNAYVTGSTTSVDFPTYQPLQPLYGGGEFEPFDAFVTKLNSDGNGLIYSTYLGGNDEDRGFGIAIDAEENAYITGPTYSVNFPSQSPFQPTIASNQDAFVTKLNNSGSSLMFSTFLGGNWVDYGNDIAVGADGSAYVTGSTSSTNFPVQNPFQVSLRGSEDAFITKFSTSGSELSYSTYVGGSKADYGNGIAVDAGGRAFMIGYTESTNFPTLDPFQASSNGGPGNTPFDVVVSKFSSSGSALIYSTFLGGSNVDHGYQIAIGTTGNAFVTGFTISGDFPTQNPLQTSFEGNWNDFVSKLNFVPCCISTRGNVAGDTNDAVNVIDITFLVQYLFQGGSTPPCMSEADVDVNNSINIVDLTTLVAFLFSGGPALPSCP